MSDQVTFTLDGGFVFTMSAGLRGEKGEDGEDGSGTGGGASFEALLVERNGSLVINRDGEPVVLRV